MITLIAAMSLNRVIGRGNSLPWNMPNDMKFFMNTTRGFPVIMGRKTFESLGKPLPKRTNIVITRDSKFFANGCILTSSIEDAIKQALQINETVFVIGGAEIYKLALPLANLILLTEIETEIADGDAFFPKFSEKEWQLVDAKSCNSDKNHAYNYKFLKYLRKTKKLTA